MPALKFSPVDQQSRTIAGLSAAVTLALVLAASGCTARQAYNTGQAWQRNECNKTIEPDQRERCQRESNKSYEDYQREIENANKP